MSILTPQDTYRKISDISLDYLINNIKIKALIFDFDGTLFIKRKISEETINFIKRAKEKGLIVSILSNNIFLNQNALNSLNINIIKKFAFKPLKTPFLEVAKKINITPKNIAVIGNNRISDIYGANKAGMYSIYIQNLSNFFFKLKIKDKLKSLGIKKVK